MTEQKNMLCWGFSKCSDAYKCPHARYHERESACESFRKYGMKNHPAACECREIKEGEKFLMKLEGVEP